MDAQALPAETAGREFAFEMRDFRVIARLLYDTSGIRLSDAKAPLVYSRLGKRLRTLGLSRFSDYCKRLEGPEGEAERGVLLSALTTNVTRFFREPHHFEALRTQLRSGLVQAAAVGGRVRLWSAGCSLGHEPYSMAMCVLAELPDAARLDIRILATDIDPMVVQRARQGIYTRDDVAPVPSDLAGRWVVEEAGQVRMHPAVRELVSFGELNLHADWPMKGGFDAIFCRNVAIYFDEPTQQRLWGRFAQRLAPEGRLYIGHSERAETPVLRSDGLTIYRRADA